ncbi:MAG: thioredoxin family protein [Thermoflexia bacterium]|nr:MAG: thioredoxin family protein [Thermoflexia bacterium]
MSLNIKVLGPGCEACDWVEQQAIAALEILAEENPDLEATIQHITDYAEITRYPILFTPGLVVNEKLVCAGRIPRIEEVVTWLREALNGTGGN